MSELPVGPELDRATCEAVGLAPVQDGFWEEHTAPGIAIGPLFFTCADLYRTMMERNWDRERVDVPSPHFPRVIYYAPVYPPVSADIVAAWRVVEALHARGECLSLNYVQTYSDWDHPERLEWAAEFRMSGCRATASTPAEAICRAALAAMERGAEVTR